MAEDREKMMKNRDKKRGREKGAAEEILRDRISSRREGERDRRWRWDRKREGGRERSEGGRERERQRGRERDDFFKYF